MSARIQRLASIALAALLLAAALYLLAPMATALAECKPDGVPDFAGNGINGSIDPAIAEPSGGNNYGVYGWAGLRWNTCDLTGFGEMPNIPAELDTWFGNVFLGAAVGLAAMMTGLHKWTADPGGFFTIIDERITDLSAITYDLFFANWVGVALMVAVLTVAAAAFTRNIRGVAITFVSIFGALAFIGFVGNAPLQLAQLTDGVASEVVSNADEAALNLVGIPSDGGGGSEISASTEEATGAILNDAILQPYWRLGQTGTTDWADNTQAMFDAATVSWADVNDYDPDERRDQYDEAVTEARSDTPNQYQSITGAAVSRAGQGFMAFLTIGTIALIRIPAEVLIFLGMMVFRFVPIIGPVFALFAIIPQMRSAATSALKIVVAAVYNVMVYGVIAAIHTAVTGVLFVGSDNYFVSLVLAAIMTYLLWQLSKPFRSVTRLATGTAVSQALAGAPEGPGRAIKTVLGMATGTVIGKMGGDAIDRRKAGKQTDQGERRIKEHDAPAIHPGWREAPIVNPQWATAPGGADYDDHDNAHERATTDTTTNATGTTTNATGGWASFTANPGSTGRGRNATPTNDTAGINGTSQAPRASVAPQHDWTVLDDSERHTSQELFYPPNSTRDESPWWLDESLGDDDRGQS